ncbi:hypothetical protein BCR33DRAFT_846362 [Rhizoclosmatium globosum]|uniref:RING-type E3 ubiquitin transferase n=1 Tax=Rhizoclosmatium globosum TaxID=329046 RepID=A0A1Y2CX54_9FUNG|nr:hypothetical protein BCR33DRAFT_846362 [Rhizoclosmatium globosum]|eukprot:ORY51600.1 hypothetical protein BCR33DRAFT_846362 [Rhizoclosmatium globosum]
MNSLGLSYDSSDSESEASPVRPVPPSAAKAIAVPPTTQQPSSVNPSPKLQSSTPTPIPETVAVVKEPLKDEKEPERSLDSESNQQPRDASNDPYYAVRAIPIPGYTFRMPPEATGEVNAQLQAKVEKWTHLRHTNGRRFNNQLARTQSFGNPSIMSKLIDFLGLQEHGTNLDASVFNPKASERPLFGTVVNPTTGQTSIVGGIQFTGAKEVEKGVEGGSNTGGGAGGLGSGKRSSKWDQAEQSLVMSHTGSKKPCIFYQKGGCRNGSSCPYSHSTSASGAGVGAEKRVCSCEFIGLNFLAGNCRFGSQCALSHSSPASVSAPQHHHHQHQQQPPIQTHLTTLHLPTHSDNFDDFDPTLPPVHSDFLLSNAVPFFATPPHSLATWRSDYSPEDRLPSPTDAVPLSVPAGSAHYSPEDPFPSFEQSVHLADDLYEDDLDSGDEFFQNSAGSPTQMRQSPGFMPYSVVAKPVHPVPGPSPKRGLVSGANAGTVENSSPSGGGGGVVGVGRVYNAENDELCPFAYNGLCRFADKCRYTHGLKCPRCQKYCLHPRNMELRDKHLEECANNETRNYDAASAAAEAAARMSNEMDCVVCFERVLRKRDPRFGLLTCEHCVCLECIRQWRQNEGMENAKACPICRQITHIIIPSSIWITDEAGKEAALEAYKKRMNRIDCKHYNFGEGTCPFGTSCLYRHVRKDGTVDEGRVRFVVGGQEGEARVIGAVQLFDFFNA